MPRTLAIVLLMLPALAGRTSAQEPLTRAERTDYRETSRYADVMRFLESVTAGRTDMELAFMGRTNEGREIPLVIVAPPALRHPARAHASGRLIIHIQGNIHAGEVEGKEAAQMLLREIAAGEHQALLEHLVLLVNPIYNVDGNEAVSTLHRRNQIGPAGGVGKRPNAQNLDLNRDYIKVDAPETRAALALFDRWDPHFLMDLHTTNGSKHRYALTFSSSLHPNADRAVQDFTDRVLTPEVQRALRPEYETFYYGNFLDPGDPSKGWGTFSWEGRYCSNYYGLRNRFSLLVETYAYRDFRTRVDVCRKFVIEVLRAAVRHRETMLDLAAAADRRVAAGEWTEMGVVFERKAWPGTRKLLGYEVTEESRRRRRPSPEDKPKDYEAPVYLAFAATESVAVPSGYLFGVGLKAIAARLEWHGVRVYRLRREGTVQVEAYRLENLKRSERPYQGRPLQHAEVTPLVKECAFRAGDYWVPIRQPLGRLAAELLEPRGRDGLLAWGFLDAFLFPQWGRQKMELPIYRVMKPLELPASRM